MDTVLESLRTELRTNVDEHTRNSSQKFFKEKVRVIGVKTSTVSKLAKKHYNKIENLNKDRVFDLCEELFKSGLLEESFIACKWSHFIHNQYEPDDIDLFEKWVNTYVDNWATCDTLCNHTVGTFIEMYPNYIGNIVKWAKSENLWMRRASAVSLIIPAKKGMFLDEALIISDLLIDETEDLVQKGFGWLLKEESRIHQKEVYDYVFNKRHLMPRTALRYAIKLMPKNMKKNAMI